MQIVSGYSNPDLRNFKAAGGKLMIIQGWEDSGLRTGRESASTTMRWRKES